MENSKTISEIINFLKQYEYIYKLEHSSDNDYVDTIVVYTDILKYSDCISDAIKIKFDDIIFNLDNEIIIGKSVIGTKNGKYYPGVDEYNKEEEFFCIFIDK